MQEKINNCTTNEEHTVKVVQEFQEFIKNKKSYYMVNLPSR